MLLYLLFTLPLYIQLSQWSIQLKEMFPHILWLLPRLGSHQEGFAFCDGIPSAALQMHSFLYRVLNYENGGGKVSNKADKNRGTV